MLKKMLLQAFVLSLAGCSGVATSLGFSLFGVVLMVIACFAIVQFFVVREDE